MGIGSVFLGLAACIFAAALTAGTIDYRIRKQVRHAAEERRRNEGLTPES